MRLAGNTVSDGGDLETRVRDCDVIVTGDLDAPMLATTLRVLVANLRRMPVRLHLDPDGGQGTLPGNLVAELIALCAGIDPELPLSIGTPEGDPVWVHVGTSDVPALARGVADGHGTRIRPAGAAFPDLYAPGTGLGAVLTAAALTAEAFKIVVEVLPKRHAPTRAIDFCPVTLGEPSAHPRRLAPLTGTALIGAGAIGTAIALILRELGAEGALTVVDFEAFDDPNVTTYSLGTVTDAEAGIRKVRLIKRESPNLTVKTFEGTAQQYIDAIDDGRYPMPRTVLGGVDTIDARHEIAGIHANRTIDGSTGGATGTMLSLHEATWTGPCLRCYYPKKRIDTVTVEQKIAAETGLSLDFLANGDAVVTAELIDGLSLSDSPVTAALRDHIGKPVCGLGKALGLTGTDGGFNPSAAFVAQQAACLVVGAVIRGEGPDLGVDVQYDALFGPYEDMTVIRVADGSCRCVADRGLHDRVRSLRQGVQARETPMTGLGAANV